MTTVNTPRYLLDQARRRLTPTLNTIPGMGLLDERLRETQWPEFVFAEPPPGSGLKPVMGNNGMPMLGHLIEVFRGGPDYVLETYRKFGPVHYSKTPRSTRSPPSARTPPRKCSPTGTRTSRPLPGRRSSGRSSTAA